MQTIRLRSHVGSDGCLQLQLNDLPVDRDVEIILIYQPIETDSPQEFLTTQDDPLIGLFAGSPDLAEKSEEILQLEITPNSGWTWKS
ncbi:hypothetical protein TUMEXPCC7403_15140 [Tumidithrix helvetica PCC 7403]|uniref:hypothetical protein n=1 Tax=Tumidithrix helvetica TaxID=3457545 RepID=UPI003C8155BB